MGRSTELTDSRISLFSAQRGKCALRGELFENCLLYTSALAASDEVLIPVEASYLPIKGLQQLLKTIGKVRKQINPKLQVGGIRCV